MHASGVALWGWLFVCSCSSRVALGVCGWCRNWARGKRTWWDRKAFRKSIEKKVCAKNENRYHTPHVWSSKTQHQGSVLTLGLTNITSSLSPLHLRIWSPAWSAQNRNFHKKEQTFFAPKDAYFDKLSPACVIIEKSKICVDWSTSDTKKNEGADVGTDGEHKYARLVVHDDVADWRITHKFYADVFFILWDRQGTGTLNSACPCVRAEKTRDSKQAKDLRTYLTNYVASTTYVYLLVANHRMDGESDKKKRYS